MTDAQSTSGNRLAQAGLRATRQRLLVLETLAAELTKKGLKREKDKPDLLVAVQRTIDGTLNTKGSGYEWKDGRLTRYDLQKGMLVVDLVAATNKESVWRSTASGVFRPDLMPDERRKLLAEVMADMFEDYPTKR